jgi:hypothetical protein
LPLEFFRTAPGYEWFRIIRINRLFFWTALLVVSNVRLSTTEYPNSFTDFIISGMPFGRLSEKNSGNP